MANRTMPISRKDFETLRRVHVTQAHEWSTSVGTDYWINIDSNTTPWAAGQGTLSSERGWTVTSLDAATAGAGADFMTATDKGTPGTFTLATANDLVRSPSIFGDWTHAHAATEILGHRVMPRYLVGDFIATWVTTSATEATTAFGFCEDDGSIIVSADHLGAVVCGATYFALDVNATATQTTVAKDAATHLWRIVMDRAADTVTLYIDNVLGCVSTVGITADEFPAAIGVGSGTTNRPSLNQAHIWYAWNNPGAGIAY